MSSTTTVEIGQKTDVVTSDGYESWFRLQEIIRSWVRSQRLSSVLLSSTRARDITWPVSKPAISEIAVTKVVHDWTWTKNTLCSRHGRPCWFKIQRQALKCVMTKLPWLDPIVLRRSILQTAIGTAFVYPHPQYNLAGFETNDMRGCNNEGGTRLDMEETRFV